MKHNYFLAPIEVNEPPRHTQIQARCATCKKFPVCNIRTDYLKTAYLIQQILGDPQLDREVRSCDCTFTGLEFDDAAALFPEDFQVTDSIGTTFTANFKNGKYRDKDYIKTLYDIEGYLVIFDVKWSEEFSRYEFQNGEEIYYGLKYTLTSNEFDDAKLQEWRQEQIEKEEANKDIDIINTTHFSAILNCQFYDHDKALTVEEGWRRMLPHLAGPDGQCEPYIAHMATYHIEPKEVPYLQSTFSPHPVLYPVFIPKPQPPKHYPPVRRDDIAKD